MAAKVEKCCGQGRIRTQAEEGDEATCLLHGLWIVAYGLLFIVFHIVRYLVSKLLRRGNAWPVQGGIQICFWVLGSITYLIEL